MMIVRFCANGETAWGLVDEARGEVRQIAATLPAWSPRIAGGEGVCALPCTGRRHALDAIELLLPLAEDAKVHVEPGWEGARLVPAPRQASRGHAADAVAFGVAIVGAPLTGRRNPLRSLFGYATGLGHIASVDGAAIMVEPCLETRQRYGDIVPDLSGQWSAAFGRRDVALAPCGDLVGLLEAIDIKTPLRAGDMIVFSLSAKPALADDRARARISGLGSSAGAERSAIAIEAGVQA